MASENVVNEAMHSAPESVQAPIGHESAFPAFDAAQFPSHLFWLAISFGILYFLMVRVIVPRLGGILEDRRDRIAGDLGEAERLREETDAAVEAYETELAEARKKAHAIAQERREQIKADNDARRRKAEEDLSGKIAAAESQIADIKAKALGEVETIATDAAEAVLETIQAVSVERSEVESAVRTVKE
ncbi:F0F1 ATP synthase subunit B [Amorphus orientalis]|uniref:ATP synthase subunit b n=1 Tax=Amorphus orientalis TaxID=649198 RepID=A0AAE3VLP0_9HYPH|nr:F0F1 ATP synthase subunit B [Amorphus orientalis]MDQ0313941.1 F-type H+-transporting ATPase subunit b [Amorphus orientalis]